MHTIEEILRKKKIKVTPQRMAVFSILKQSKFHPNVEMIYQKLKPDFPAMSLATVYKTMEVLKRVGLIQELNVGEGGLRYDAQIRPHSHVYCQNCGKVVDVDHFPIENLQDSLLEKVKRETGFDILFTQLYFFGICPECSDKKRLRKLSS